MQFGKILNGLSSVCPLGCTYILMGHRSGGFGAVEPVAVVLESIRSLVWQVIDSGSFMSVDWGMPTRRRGVVGWSQFERQQNRRGHLCINATQDMYDKGFFY